MLTIQLFNTVLLKNKLVFNMPVLINNDVMTRTVAHISLKECSRKAKGKGLVKMIELAICAAP